MFHYQKQYKCVVQNYLRLIKNKTPSISENEDAKLLLLDEKYHWTERFADESFAKST